MPVPHPPSGSGCFIPPDKTIREKRDIPETMERPRVLDLWSSLDDPENTPEFRTTLWAELGCSSVSKTLRAWLDAHA